jgi:hypothetical protein
MNSIQLRGPAASFVLASLALPAGAQLQVIYTKVPGSPTAAIPGTLDLSGMPAPTTWRAIEDFSVNADGTTWVVKGRTQLGSDLETVLVRGSATSGTMFCQEGQPFQGAPGELYDFFDTGSPVSFDETGRMGFSARAKGGATNDDEKIVFVDAGGVHTVVLQQGSAVTGCQDLAPNPSGDELVGNSIGSVQLLNDGTVAFGVTPITNCHSSRYPGHFRGNAMFRQSGASAVGAETWKSISYDGAGTTPNGLHWYAEGTRVATDTTTDGILVVDDAIVLQEGSPIPSTSQNVGDFFQTAMANDGSWITRGRDNSATTAVAPDFVVRNGVLLAKSGDSVEGLGEQWGDTFYAVALDANGHWAIAGRTNSADPAADDVLVIDGVVVLRENDPVDVNGNGVLDDDAFIGRGNNTLAAFDANDVRLAGGYAWLILELRNAAGQDLHPVPAFGTPNAFARIAVGTDSTPFCSGDGSATACPCGNAGAAGHGCGSSVAAVGARLSSTGLASISADTLLFVGSDMPNSSALYFQGTAQTGGGAGVVFGDGLRCVGGSVIRLGTQLNINGSSVYPEPGDLPVSVRGANVAGALRHYQIWYRNAAAFCTAATFNLSNGLSLTWGP